MPVPLVLGEAVMILGADRRALSAAFLAARLEGESTFSRIGAAGTVAFLGIAAAASAAFTAAAKGAAQVEKGIAGAGAVAFATNSQLAAMTQKSLDLSHAMNSVFKPTEIAGAMEVMIKAGVSLEDTLNGGASAALTLASAGGADLTKSAEFIARAMKIWGLETKDLTMLINHMAGAANLSTLDVDDLTAAVANAAATAATAGTTVEDFFALSGITAKWFPSGAQLGTAYKNFINKLIPQTKDAREEMMRLGLTTEEGLNKFFDAEGKIKPAVEIVRLWNEALGDAPPAEIVESINKIFSPRGAGNRFAVGIIKTTREEFADFKDELAGMSAAEIAARRLDNTSDAVTRLRRTIAALSMEFVSPFLPNLKQWALAGTAELPRIFDALREGLTGQTARPRVLAPDEQSPVARDAPIRRDITSTSEEAAGRGMPGAGPSDWEARARRVGDFIRSQLIPRLREAVQFVRGELLPAFQDFAEHDVWPKIQAGAQLIGAVFVPALRAIAEATPPTVRWLSEHKEILGALIAGYLTYITISAGVTTALYTKAAAMGAYRTAALGVLIVQGLLNKTLLVNPWSLVAVAVGALVVAGILLYKNWDDVERLFDELSPVLKVLAAAVWAATAAWTGYMLIARTATTTQWLLNAAMAANPIGLVVVAIGALVAAAIVLNTQLDTLHDKAAEVERGFTGAEDATGGFVRSLVIGVRRAIDQVAPGLGLLMEAIDAVSGAMDRLSRKQGQVTGGKPADAVGGRITADDVPEFGGPEGERVSISDEQGADWRNAPPSNPNYRPPEEQVPAGMWRNPLTGQLEAIYDEEEISDLGDYQMRGTGEDEAKAARDKEADRLQNAIDALNDRFFQELSAEVYQPDKKAGDLNQLIARQGMIRAEISRTAQLLMDTLGVGLPEAFERASELVLERIDEMEKELEKGPPLKGYLGFLAAFNDLQGFEPLEDRSSAKAGDTFVLNGGLNITPDPGVPGGIDVNKAESVWKQQKFARQP